MLSFPPPPEASTDREPVQDTWNGKGDQQPAQFDTNQLLQNVSFVGHQGPYSYVNGTYLQEANLFNDGLPVFHRRVQVGGIARDLFMFYHRANGTWVVAHQQNTHDMVAFVQSTQQRPENITQVWNVKSLDGLFKQDSNIRVVKAEEAEQVSQFRKRLMGKAEINVFQQRLSSDQLRDICDELSSDGCALQRLKLFSNGFLDDEAVLLSNALKHNSSITHFQLRANAVTSTGAKAIAEAIRGHRSLQLLSLRGNNINDEGAIAIAEALRANQSLIGISLRENEITHEGARRLINALEVNTTLKGLAIYDNSVPAKEIKKLKKMAGHLSSCVVELEPPMHY
jgi:hypothetical protein